MGLLWDCSDDEECDSEPTIIFVNSENRSCCQPHFCCQPYYCCQPVYCCPPYYCSPPYYGCHSCGGFQSSKGCHPCYQQKCSTPCPPPYCQAKKC